MANSNAATLRCRRCGKPVERLVRCSACGDRVCKNCVVDEDGGVCTACVTTGAEAPESDTSDE